MANGTTTDLSDEMFLFDVEDSVFGRQYKTLSLSHTPTILMSVATTHFADFASRVFKTQLDLGSAEWRAIFSLARAPGITAAELSKDLGLDKGTISRCLKKLEAKSLIQGGELHANGRSRGWYLSDTGMKVHEKILSTALTGLQNLLKDFKAEEVDLLCQLLGRFLNNVDNLKD